jgi:PAS domain S-box-containing protein
MDNSKPNLRDKILGLGKNSLRKSYYLPLRESTEGLERYKALLDQTCDVICLLELPSLNFIDMNQSAQNFFGIDEFVQNKFNLLNKIGSDCKKTISAWIDCAFDERNIPLRMNIKHHSPALGSRDIELNLSRVEFSKVDYAVCVIHDMTDYRKVLDALSQSEENLRITLNSIGDAVIATDRNGVITRINPVALELTGVTLPEAIGQPLNKIFIKVKSSERRNPEDLIFSNANIRHFAALDNHSILISKDRKEYHIAESSSPIKDDNGKIVGSVLTFRDITLEHELENKLFQSRKMESIGQLAGGIAHDFNNMLTGILASADLLQKKIDLNESTERLVSIIIDSATRAANLTQKLLAFAQKGKLISQPTCVHEIIKNATTMLSSSIDKRIDIKMALDADNSCVSGDPGQLTNMLLNLGVNSRDAMPEGGRIFISTRNVNLSESCPQCGFTGLTPGNYLKLQFSDTGCGIPAEIRDRIFDPFVTSKPIGSGTGMGLAAVYGTVKDHSGAIEIENSSDKGTTFNIYLPLAEQNNIADSPKVRDRSIATPERQECVLIIEDEEVVRLTAAEILHELGYKVITACDGIDGIEKYQANQEQINAVILDMVMPRMNGRECFQHLKKINPDAKILISSGFTSEEAMRNLNIDNAAGFLKKPFTVAELYEAMLEACGVSNKNNHDK